MRPQQRLPAAALCLVSCSARKQHQAAPAKDLYQSELFRKARGLVEARGWPWFILSAEHGLVDPEQVIEPYDKTLNKMGSAQRRAWAERCLHALQRHLAGVESVVFLAGKKYRQFLAPALSELGINVEVPLASLGIGEQLAWLNRNTS